MNRFKSITEFKLDAPSSANLARAFEGYTLPATEGVVDAIDEARRRWVAAAPLALTQRLVQLRGGRGLAGLLVDGLPFDRAVLHGLVEPEVALAPKATRQSEGLLIGATSQIGSVFGVAPEGKGVINNLCPLHRDRAKVTGLGSRLPLDLHTENAAMRRMRCEPCTDGLALIGLSADPAGAPSTCLSDGRLALRELGPEDDGVLRDPTQYLISLPERWAAYGLPDRVQGPIVAGYGAELTFSFAFYGDMVEPATLRARRALDRFHDALKVYADDVFLRPGMALFINNRVAGHGRGGWEPTYTPEGAPLRFVQRTFWISDLARLAGWTQVGRVFAPPR